VFQLLKPASCTPEEDPLRRGPRVDLDAMQKIIPTSLQESNPDFPSRPALSLLYILTELSRLISNFNVTRIMQTHVCRPDTQRVLPYPCNEITIQSAMFPFKIGLILVLWCTRS
jgi:hypothetical protein